MISLDLLEQNLNTLLQQYTALQQENQTLRECLENQRNEVIRVHAELAQLQQEHRHQIQANALLGDDEHRQKVRRQLSAMIDQVDKAITILAQ